MKGRGNRRAADVAVLSTRRQGRARRHHRARPRAGAHRRMVGDPPLRRQAACSVRRAGNRAFVFAVSGGPRPRGRGHDARLARDRKALRAAMRRVLRREGDSRPRTFVPAEAQAKRRMLGRTLAGTGDRAGRRAARAALQPRDLSDTHRRVRRRSPPRPRRRPRGGNDQRGDRVGHAAHVPRAARDRLPAGGRERLQQRRPRARRGDRGAQLPPRATRPARADRALRHRDRSGVARRGLAAARAAGVVVQDRSAGPDRRSARPRGVAAPHHGRGARAARRTATRRRPAAAWRDLRDRDLRGVLRGGSGDPAVRPAGDEPARGAGRRQRVPDPARGHQQRRRRGRLHRRRGRLLLAAGLLAVGSSAGGVLGARVGRRLSPGRLRAVVIVVGLAAIARLVFGS